MWQRFGFTARIFLASAALVILALAAAAALTYTRGARVADAAARAGIEHSRAVQQELQTLRFARLKLMSRLLATDPYFLSYVAAATGDNLTGPAQPDTRSMTDLLSERQADLGFDFGMVLDNSGQFLAATGSAPAAHGSLASDPLVSAALQAQNGANGYWLRNGHVYQVAIAPLANRDELSGYLVLGLAVDQALANQVKQVSGSELVLLDPQGARYMPVLATLDAPQLGDLPSALRQLASLPRNQVFNLRIGGEHWLAYASPLGATGDAGTALTLTSFDQAVSGYRQIFTLQVLAAVIATLAALLLSLWLSSRLSRPLRQLAQAAQAAARGDFQRRFEARGRGEIAQLTHAFDSLLSDLREKSEIENYMADLAKYLPDNSAEQTTVPPTAQLAPRSLSAALVALEILEGGAALGTTLPERSVTAFGGLLVQVQAAAAVWGGRFLAAAGNRLWLLFEGAETPALVHQALAAAGHVQTELHAQSVMAGAALGYGGVVVGTAELDGHGTPCVLGAPVQELERLLPEAASGVTLVTPAAARLLKDVSGVALQPVTGQRNGRRLLAAALTAPAVPAPAAEGSTVIGTLPVGIPPAARARVAPGMVLGERYEILSELGAGGMAVVYKARDRQLGEVVALKTLKADAAHNGMLLDAMKSEIRLARKITHRNVLRIYDFGNANGVAFISMEYVRGMTLKYLLQNRERVPFAAGLRIMRQVCTALQVAHEQSVLHRDIKPENVMLEPGGNAKLMDFGIASPILRGEERARERYIVGTPRYAAPEQLRGETVDERADLYSCGVLMYQMFTGKLPFTERDIGRLIELKSQERYEAPTERIKDMPPAFENVIRLCLKANREQRPASAARLLEILEAIRV